MNNAVASPYQLNELNKETRMGSMGSETHAREIRRIDLSNYDERKNQIADELWSAAVDVGFFQVYNHGIDLSEIQQAFAMAERFFALPAETKAKYPLRKAYNAGWESKAQVRPSTGTPDQKESYQITRPWMNDLWPAADELADFQRVMLEFEARCWQLGMRLLSCFADKLGFDSEFFTRAHTPSVPGYQSTLRLLHYYAIPPEYKDKLDLWRAG